MGPWRSQGSVFLLAKIKSEKVDGCSGLNLAHTATTAWAVEATWISKLMLAHNELLIMI